jgi:hypothetical protein
VELIIKINLDNDALQSKYEIARCLSRTAGDILDALDNAPVNSAGFISDINGNQVGQWDIIE